MKFQIGLLVAVAVVAVVKARSIDSFEEFKKTFNKSYSSAEEESARRAIFYQSLKYVQEHQDTATINMFADLTTQEFHETFMLPESALVNSSSFYSMCNFQLKSNPPASKDLRAEHKLTPVKMQGSCGSCWIFASISATESAYLTKHQKTLDLSEQELVDCASATSCRGGTIPTAMNYLQTKGAVNENVLPYTGKQGSCPHLNGERHKISSWCSVGSHSPDEIKKILHTTDTAIVALIGIHDVSAFQHYNGKSVITQDRGLSTSWHAINIVGWGHKDGQDYWLIKNSWSTRWGDAGYGYMEQRHDLMHINDHIYVAMV